MRKRVAFVLIGACVAILLWASPTLWAFRDGFAQHESTGVAAVWGFLPLFACGVFVLTPIWIIGTWLLWVDYRLRRAYQPSPTNNPSAP